MQQYILKPAQQVCDILTSMTRERIGLFGGTFDPPHLGHFILASEANSQLGLDRLLWTVTPDPPHKQDQTITSVEHRLAMVKLAIKDNPSFELSRVELDRPGPHYTLDTVEIIADKYPDADITPIIGGDSLRDLPTWHRPKEILYACHWVGVMRRPGEEANLEALERRVTRDQIQGPLCGCAAARDRLTRDKKPRRNGQAIPLLSPTSRLRIRQRTSSLSTIRSIGNRKS